MRFKHEISFERKIAKICDAAIHVSAAVKFQFFKNTLTNYFRDLILEIIFILMRYFLLEPG